MADAAWPQQLQEDGFVHCAQALSTPAIVPELLSDASLFDQQLDHYRDIGAARVPYLITDAIARVVADEAVCLAVAQALGTDDWVMWGSNIRRATPNSAGQWHTDLESDLWPTLTMAIGLADCNGGSATWFRPGSHTDAHAVTSTERAAQQVRGFGNGCFYLFDAHCQHRSDPATTDDRVVLFLHFQKSTHRRIPYMLDYLRDSWSSVAAPWMAGPYATRIETRVARPTLFYRFSKALFRLKQALA